MTTVLLDVGGQALALVIFAVAVLAIRWLADNWRLTLRWLDLFLSKGNPDLLPDERRRIAIAYENERYRKAAR